jgi:membrane-associated phospholipid phosphatase
MRGKDDRDPGGERRRSVEAFVEALSDVEQPVNDRYADTTTVRGVDVAPFWFTKGMPLATDGDGDPYPEGIVPAAEKEANYLDAAVEERFAGGDAFTRGGRRLFIGPPGSNSVPLAGMDSHRGRMPPAPDPRGPVTAAEMLDAYAMEQLRDVPFTAWPNEPTGPDGSGRQSVAAVLGDPETPAALSRTIEALREDLDAAADGPGERWYDTRRLFVEAGDGTVDWWGPYVSQFLVHEVELWSLPAEQRYLRYERGKDYNDGPAGWLDTLAGRDDGAAETDPNTPSGGRGYLATPRHLATMVNAEPPYQEYLIAALRLLGKVAFDPGLAYVTTDDLAESDRVFNYTDGGPVGLLDMVARTARLALLAAFHQKYERHFRCRPETYGGRVHAQRQGEVNFGVDDLLTGSALLAARPGETDYLSTAYEEGSPVHPAYPSGHSVIAGACGTVLKTWFQNVDWGDTGLEYRVVTHEGDGFGTGVADVDVPSGHEGVHQEVDKLVSNVGLARMFAGVHYYSDHYWGVKLGEQVAFALMADVFARGTQTTEDGGPTFTPYLQYGADAEVQVPGPTPVETLDAFRWSAADRRPGAPWPH